MKFLHLESVDSTNSWLKSHAAELDAPLLLTAGNQTAGRGQRGNSWESTTGKNLTASILFRPECFEASRQFAISEATALAVVDTLADLGVDARVKWPNDIYAGNKKICGILIENAIWGTEISQCIIGIGLNINQETFISDAPNPVSVKQLTGIVSDLKEVSSMLAAHFVKRMATTGTDCAHELHEEYMRRMWRNDGAYPFRDKNSGEVYMARISDVEPGGYLILKPETGGCRRYAFKEVEFIL